MKLGVSYNLFDGEELLESSIKSIRGCVDYISVVYQRVSNFGQRCSDDIEDLLSHLQHNRLIDEIKLYSPSNVQSNPAYQGSINELTKRNIGLDMSRDKNCTHHLCMDTDEFYIEREFNDIKSLIYSSKFDASACKLQTYYKLPTMIIDPPEEYFVPFICKIYPNSKYQLGGPSPVLVDPTRRISTYNKFAKLGRTGIQMHHMSYVRKDIRKKLENSSAKNNFNGKIERFITHWENWTEGNKALLAGVNSIYYNLLKVKNTFNIDI